MLLKNTVPLNIMTLCGGMPAERLIRFASLLLTECHPKPPG